MKLGPKSQVAVCGLLCSVSAFAGWLSVAGEGKPGGDELEGAAQTGRGPGTAANDNQPPGRSLTLQQAERAATGDPAAFAERILDSEIQPSAALVDRFFESWLAVQPVEAAEAAVKFPGRFRLNDSKVFTIAYKRLLQSQPDVAIELLDVGDGRLGDFCLYRGTSRVLEDPELQALNVPPNFDRMRMSKEEFSERIPKMFPSAASKRLANQYGVYLGKTIPFEEALKWGELLPENYRYPVIISLVWSDGNEEAVMEYLNSASRDIVRDFGVHFVVANSYEDPESAMEWIEGRLGNTSYNPSLSVLANWVQTDFGGAKKYVNSLENPQNRHLAAIGVAQALSKNSIPEALDWVRDWSGERQEVLDSTVRYALNKSGVKDFLNYVKKNSDQAFNLELKRALEKGKDRARGRNKERIEELLRALD